MYTISDAKVDVTRKLHGTSINKIQGFYELAYEAARNVLNRIDPRETKRKQPITNALFDQVYNYSVPSDLKGKRILDIRPQATRSESDNFSQHYNEEFDRRKTNNTFTIEDDDGVKTVRISKTLRAGATYNECDSLTANGTWAAAGGATGLEVDTLYYITAGGALKFDLGATGGYIENSTMAQVDLTDYLLQGLAFMWVYLPTAANAAALTSINLLWGSSATDYYSKTVTAPFYGSWQQGWNLIAFDWSALTETGSPTITTYDYARVTFVSTAAITDVRVDSIVFRLPSIYETVYYSKYLFSNSSGTWIEKPTADTDVVNLDTESYNLWLYELLELVAQELQGEDSSFDVEFWRDKKKEQWDAYIANNRSEAQPSQDTYYRQLYRRRR